MGQYLCTIKWLGDRAYGNLFKPGGTNAPTATGPREKDFKRDFRAGEEEMGSSGVAPQAEREVSSSNATSHSIWGGGGSPQGQAGS